MNACRRRPPRRRSVLVAGLLFGACTHVSPPAHHQREPAVATVREYRLPAHVRPIHYALDFTIVPGQERFSGAATITVELDRAEHTIELHGQDLHVTQASVEVSDGTCVSATWHEVGPDGRAELALERAVGPGTIRLQITWDAAFDRQLRGIFGVNAANEPYAFTQFEPTLARRAFPSFDEPRFKTRYDVTVTAPDSHALIANTAAVESESAGSGMKRVRFGTTDRLPTYLIALAVGPLDVVEAPPLPANDIRSHAVPFRGVAARGRGAQLAYALAQTPPLVAALEEYFAIPYPYEKLDVIAVPDLTWGGMENAGAITFREWVLLLEPATAPEEQRRGFASVMAHELAHQWFGDLVTMQWWDDLWLNEAFASWIGERIVNTVHLEYHAETSLLESIHGAMDTDSLSSARSVRQPIETPHDIVNAFDSITYDKGAGVLAMFERWIGPDAFRAGIRQYFETHGGGNATTEDLLRALSQASGRDVATPFASFLTQPGVPLVDVRVTCSGGTAQLELRQSRSLPVGSTAARGMIWHIPICVRYGTAAESLERCTLLTEPTGTFSLDTTVCPTWVMPNADGVGYYRWVLPAADLERLRLAGWATLSTRERLSLADSLNTAFASATLPAADLFAALVPLAADEHRPVAIAPMELVIFAHDQLVDEAGRPAVEAFAAELYLSTYRRLGWSPQPGEDGETKLLRGKVIGFLATVAMDQEVRREAAARGRLILGYGGDGRLHVDAVAPELFEPALTVAIQDGDAAVFDAAVAHLLASQDELVRAHLLNALGMARTPGLAERARNLSLNPDVRINEMLIPLWRQMADPVTRPATWEWIKTNFDALTARLPEQEAGETPWLAMSFCDQAAADDVQSFFAPRIDTLVGGPRNLASTVEGIRLCAARAAAQRTSARQFFSEKRGQEPFQLPMPRNFAGLKKGS